MKLKEALPPPSQPQRNLKDPQEQEQGSFQGVVIQISRRGPNSSDNGMYVATLVKVEGFSSPKAVTQYGVKLEQKAKSGHEALKLMADQFSKAGFLE